MNGNYQGLGDIVIKVQEALVCTTKWCRDEFVRDQIFVEVYRKSLH